MALQLLVCSALTTWDFTVLCDKLSYLHVHKGNIDKAEQRTTHESLDRAAYAGSLHYNGLHRRCMRNAMPEENSNEGRWNAICGPSVARRNNVLGNPAQQTGTSCGKPARHTLSGATNRRRSVPG